MFRKFLGHISDGCVWADWQIASQRAVLILTFLAPIWKQDCDFSSPVYIFFLNFYLRNQSQFKYSRNRGSVPKVSTWKWITAAFTPVHYNIYYNSREHTNLFHKPLLAGCEHQEHDKEAFEVCP